MFIETHNQADVVLTTFDRRESGVEGAAASSASIGNIGELQPGEPEKVNQ